MLKCFRDKKKILEICFKITQFVSRGVNGVLERISCS